MTHPDENFHQMSSLKYLEEKQIEEYRQYQELHQERRRERMVLLGYVVISLICTLLISGAMNFSR